MTTTALHDGTLGDIWASLASLQQYYKMTGKKVVLYLTNGQTAHYYDGAVHPTLGEDGKTMVMLNDKMIKMAIPLLKAQPYIEDAVQHNGEPIGINLNMIRETFVNMPYHSLAKWYQYVFPDLACDLSKPYMFVPETFVNYAIDKIVISRTERYLNPQISYYFLKGQEDKFVFAGTELEHIIFNARFGLNVKRMVVSTFLELAQAVKQSRGTLSNQTQLAQLSEAMKVPRIVELCNFAPNVDFVGENAFEFYAQVALEYYVARLLGEEIVIKQANTQNGFPLPPPINL